MANVTDRIRLRFVAGTSNKFWEAEIVLTDSPEALRRVRWGRIGTAGQSKEWAHPTALAARSEHNIQIRRKLNEGYVVDGGDREMVRSYGLKLSEPDALSTSAFMAQQTAMVPSPGSAYGFGVAGARDVTALGDSQRRFVPNVGGQDAPSREQRPQVRLPEIELEPPERRIDLEDPK